MLLEDTENPTGMFSKAGRLSIEMFSLLQEKDNIMNNKKKTYHVKNMDEKPKDKQYQSANIYQTTTHSQKKLNLDKNNHKFNAHQSKQNQPFTKYVSRTHLDNVDNRIRINNEKFGMYNPKYHYIFEKGPFYEDKNFIEEQKEKFQKDKNLSTIRVDKIKQNDNQTSKSPKKLKYNKSQDILEKSINVTQSVNSIVKSMTDIQYQRVKGQVKFSRMKNREAFFDGPGPHENRFLYLELPKIYSKNNYSQVHNSKNIYFDKAPKDSDLFKMPNSGLQYDLNLNAIYPKSPKMIPNFEKVSARQFPYKPVYTLDETYADTSLYKNQEIKSNNESQILKKIPTMKFERMLPRQKGENKIKSTLSDKILLPELYQN